MRLTVYKEQDVMEALSEIYVDVLGSPVAERTLLRVKQAIRELETVEIKNLKDGTIPDHWAELFKAESEGRLIVLPCKVGDTVYTAQRGVVSELSVDHFELYNVGIELYNVGIWVSWNLISGIYGKFRMDGFPASDIGKTVFLTREAAEAALERSKSDGD